jgi:DNA gyrase subunit A
LLMRELNLDQLQVRAVLDLQNRKLAGFERQQIAEAYEQAQAASAEYESILASPEAQRELIGTEAGEKLLRFFPDREVKVLSHLYQLWG